MNTILLLGGTGAIGMPLARLLVERGDRVVVTSREARKNGLGIEYVCGNAKDVSFLRSVIDNVVPDVIVDFMIYSTEEFRSRVNFLLGIGVQYVFLSSYTVFAKAERISENSTRLLDATTDPMLLAADPYPIRKARCEDMLRNSSFRNWTIVRPGITYSGARLQFGCLESHTWLFRAMQGLPVVMPKAMRTCETTMTYGGDVARMLAELIGNKKAYGEDFNLSTSGHRSWKYIADVYAEMVGLIVTDCSVEDYCMIVGSDTAVSDRMSNRILNNDKILSVTGMSQDSFMPLADGLRRELLAFKAHPVFQYQEFFKSARIDRILGTRTNLSGMTFGQRLAYYQNFYPKFGWLCANASIALKNPGRVVRKVWNRISGTKEKHE